MRNNVHNNFFVAPNYERKSIVVLPYNRNCSLSPLALSLSLTLSLPHSLSLSLSHSLSLTLSLSLSLSLSITLSFSNLVEDLKYDFIF